MTCSFRRCFFGILLCLALAAPGRATTYVLMSDQALADGSPLIVEGRVTAKGQDPRTPRAATRYTVEVSRVLKGSGVGDTVPVRVLGGIPSEDEPWMHVWGAPRFRLGEEVLLFLTPRRDGDFGLSQLALGAFRTATREGRRLAFRPEVVHHGIGGEERLRDLDAFARWLADRARGRVRPADYFVAPSEDGLPGLAERFNLFEFDGMNYRWFKFDLGSRVLIHANREGQPGMPGGGFREVATGFGVWARDPGSNVMLGYGGQTGSRRPFLECNGEDLVVFDDPHDEIEGSYDCDRGGILAIGGVCVFGTASFRGTDYWRISEGDVLTQDGAGCVFGAAGGKVGEFIFGHEAGHALGIGHSCGRGYPDDDCSDPRNLAALMVPSVPARAVRGVSLGDDDRAAAAALYPLEDDGEDDGWLSTAEIPGFRFQVEITPPGAAEPIMGSRVSSCLDETLCVSAAVPGRTEVLMRIVGPKPNGKLWPTFVKFTTSRVDVTVEQTATGVMRSYSLAGASPGVDELPGLFDREGFDP
ncbi:MAG: hypothetical protein PVG07_09745 [Acidobacteriota bacterium]|jgi:hypothetical protein